MNQRIEALEACIEHWERDNLPAQFYHDLKIGPDHCQCCRNWRNIGDWTCDGCPIADWSGKAMCDDTPYDLVDAEYDDHFWSETITEKTRDAIKEEIAFLKMILEWEREKANASS